MQVHFTFRNVESSNGIKKYARDKIAKMQKFLRAPLEADVILSKERHHQKVEVSVRADGERHAASAESEDMYASVDLVVDKINRQLRQARDSATSRKRHSSPGIAYLSGKNGPAPESVSESE